MIHLIKKFWNKNKIRKRLVLCFMFTVALMGVTSLYTFFSVNGLMTKMNSMFMSNVSLNELYSCVNGVEQNIEEYLSSTTKDSKRLEEYIKNSYKLREMAEKMEEGYGYDESSLLRKDIKNMILTYLGETDAAIKAKRGRDIDEYVSHYNEGTKIYGYISLYISKLNNSQFQENTKRYLSVAGNLNFVQLVNIGIMAGVIVLNIVLILWFTIKITRPIISLSRSADEISRGNFDVREINVDTNDEIGVMAEAFNRMISSIKVYISEIREKAELESRLKEQEMQNLMMKTHLKDAELQALQSQINPHFLFNTLNAGAQLAMLEGADGTCTFIESVANLFRYNLRKLDKPSTLREEVLNINNYIYILKARFADRITFNQSVDESVLDIPMPCMILQPIVENAFIHGISELENGGEIQLIVRSENEIVNVIIKDNGKGIEKEKIMKLLSGEYESKSTQEGSKSGHTTGIGMGNVINRLKLFFNTDDVLNINSKPGEGTEILITLPSRRG